MPLLLDQGTEIPVLLLETILIFAKKPVEMVIKHPVKHRVFRMTLAIDPCHGSKDDSRNRPGGRKESQILHTPEKIQEYLALTLPGCNQMLTVEGIV